MTTTTSSDEVQLLAFWPSPYAMRAQLALTAKGIPFTNLQQNLINKSPLLLQSNPVHKKIPVLLHRGQAICESVVIVQYIDEAFPSPDGKDLLPKDPYDKAVARFWADFIDNKLLSTLIGLLRKSGDARNAALEEVRGYLNVLEEGLASIGKESPYFGGANVGFLDIILGPLTVWFPAAEEVGGFELQLEKLPRLAAWMKAFQQTTVAECLPPSQKLAEFGRMLFSPK